ncbi:hypothetical protein Tco_0882697 [Tanacetum coccineum]
MEVDTPYRVIDQNSDVEHEEEETGNDSNPATNDVNEEGEFNFPHSASSPHSVHYTHSDLSLHFEDQHNVCSGDYNLHRSGNDHTQHAATGSTGWVVSSSSGGLGRWLSPPDIWLVMEQRSLLPLREKDNLLDQNKAQEEKIKQLEEALVSKDLSLLEEKMTVDNLKGNLECLTADLAQMEIVKHNYARHLLPTCKSTFMSAFDGIFVKSYPYVVKIAESFRLPLGDLQNMWPEGEGPTIGGGAANV